MEIFSDARQIHAQKRCEILIVKGDDRIFHDIESSDAGLAELIGVLRAAEIAKEGDIIRSDSLSNVNVVNRAEHHKFGRKDFNEILQQIRAIGREKSLRFQYVNRSHNLAGKILEQNRKRDAKNRKKPGMRKGQNSYDLADYAWVGETIQCTLLIAS